MRKATSWVYKLSLLLRQACITQGLIWADTLELQPNIAEREVVCFTLILQIISYVRLENKTL